MLCSPPSIRILTSNCPTDQCYGLLLYLQTDDSVECWICKVKHKVVALNDVSETRDVSSALATLWKLMTQTTSKTAEPEDDAPVTTTSSLSVAHKVRGLSTYHCKLLSPLLTCHGIDKTGRAKPLQELKNCTTFDCSWLSDRSFCIEPDHVDVPGYGKDKSGSVEYLAGTLSLLQSYNNNRDALVPLHVDGDGHCLVHAVSRAIVGRELFWHALRTGLKIHLQENLHKYKALLSDFINSSEWKDIIAECDPEYAPRDNEMLGLRNIHVFGLANILRRPVLLVDSVAGMQSSGDYSALFLPGLVPPEECRDRNGELNRPICLAWSSSGRNHYIPLVGIRGCEPPIFPRSLLPKVWGVSQTMVEDYIEFNDWDCLTIGGKKALQDAYLSKLTSAMDVLFKEKNGVDPGLVADVYYSNFKREAAFGVKPQDVANATKTAVHERRLFRCVACGSVNLHPLSAQWLRPRGLLYNLAKRQAKDGMLQDQHTYTFHNYGITCKYNARKDILMVDRSTHSLDDCSSCGVNKLRLILNDGSVQFENGDTTSTVVDSPSARCKCGFKHWFNGREYDNPPLKIPINVSCESYKIVDEILWFHDESDSSLNSNGADIAAFLLHKHLSGRTAPSKLRQLIIDTILERKKRATPSATQTCCDTEGTDDQSSSRTMKSALLQSFETPDVEPKKGLPMEDKQLLPTTNPKKRQSDEHGGAIPKQRSPAAALAAAAAINRAASKLDQGSCNSKLSINQDRDETKEHTKLQQVSQVNPAAAAERDSKSKCFDRKGDTSDSQLNTRQQQVLRLGPGYSVITPSAESPETQSKPLSDQKLRDRYHKATEIMNRLQSITGHWLDNASGKEITSLNATPSSSSSRTHRTDSTDQDKLWNSAPRHGSLSRVADLLNLGGRNRSDSLSDDDMVWSDEDPM